MEATFPHIKKLDKHVALIGPTKLEAEKKHGIIPLPYLQDQKPVGPMGPRHRRSMA